MLFDLTDVAEIQYNALQVFENQILDADFHIEFLWIFFLQFCVALIGADPRQSRFLRAKGLSVHYDVIDRK